MNEKIVKASALVVGGVGVGAVGGYFLAKNRLEAKYEALTEQEIESVKAQYKRLHKEGEFSAPTPPKKVYGEKLSKMGYVSPVDPSDLVDAMPHITEEDVEELEQMTRIVQAGRAAASRMLPDEETADEIHLREQAEAYAETQDRIVNIWDTPQPEERETAEWEREQMASRDGLTPYWISVEEFMANDKGFDQITISYFEGDDTLVDERQQLIPDVEGTIGAEQLQMFGKGSQDKSVVYVRNEKLGSDFEVVKEDGSYSVMVLGMDEDELDTNGRRPRGRKLRDDRDD